MIFDRHGVLQETIVGEGSDAAINAEVAKLVAQK
jgi:hypothetical protein